MKIVNGGDRFVGQVVPPCIMPTDISLRIGGPEEGVDVRFPRYDRAAVKSGERGSKLLIGYVTGRDKVVDDDVAAALLDIYSSVRKDMDSYYMLAALSDWHESRRAKMMEQYRENCAGVEAYLKTPNWNVIKKSILSNRLSKKMISLQMELVNNTIWGNKVMRKSRELDSYQDRIGIWEHIRGGPRGSMTGAYEEAREEYEGLMSTVSSVDKMTSQHNYVLLSTVAVAAGLVGALIVSLPD